MVVCLYFMHVHVSTWVRVCGVCVRGAVGTRVCVCAFIGVGTVFGRVGPGAGAYVSVQEAKVSHTHGHSQQEAWSRGLGFPAGGMQPVQ